MVIGSDQQKKKTPFQSATNIVIPSITKVPCTKYKCLVLRETVKHCIIIIDHKAFLKFIKINI